MQHIGTIARRLAHIALMLAAFAAIPVAAQGGADLRGAISACQSGDMPACTRAGMIYSDPDSSDYDTFLSLRYLQDGCRARDERACGRLALIYFEGTDDIDADHATAGKFAIEACAERERTGCEVAEAVFADAASPYFDATKALRYRRTNCDFGKIPSCEDLARIYYNLEDFAPAEQVAARACGAAKTDGKPICDFAANLKQHRLRIEQALAQQAAARQQRMAERERASAVVHSFLAQRNYDSAIYAAIYHSRSTADAQAALEATMRAGALGSIYKDHLYVLDYWFPTGALNGAVNAEIARRASGNDCGIYNCTNRPGASTRRWAAQGGGSGSASRSRSSGSSFQPAKMKSAAEIARDTRNKYRSAHCTMNNNANRYLCS